MIHKPSSTRDFEEVTPPMSTMLIPAPATLERPTPAFERAGAQLGSVSASPLPTSPFTAAPVEVTSTLPCHVNDAEMWFAETPEGVEEAKALCRSCPIRATCLDGALDRREPWGVWGGELLAQGVVVPRKRPRGRPRKNDAA
jgi:WhiB family redox-sensing transcriptional regulator